MSIFKPDYKLEWEYPERRREHNFKGLKFCPGCKTDKNVNEFALDKIDGETRLYGYCRFCIKARRILRLLELGKSVKSTSRFSVFKGYKYCKLCPDQTKAIKPINEFVKIHNFYTCQSGICHECNRQWHKDWRASWPKERYDKWLEKENQKGTKRRKENPLLHRGYAQKHRLKNKDAINASYRLRRRTDPKYRIDRDIKSAISGDLKRRGSRKNGRAWRDLVGYNAQDLENRLKITMFPDMTWKDYLNADLHLAHVLPREAFNFKDYNDPLFRLCWSKENLKLDWASKNMSEMDRLPDGTLARDLKTPLTYAELEALIAKENDKLEEILLATRAY